MKPAYYNEIEPYCAQWLRNLITAGHIPAGEVDERDIREVRGDDLKGFGACHFFAGIAGWAYAARLAGIPDDEPIWTASCPCPPFSSAGKRQKCPECESRLLVWCPRRTGFAICADCGHAWMADPRHLWPEVWRLAAERRPQRIYGEQVTSVEGIDWFAGVRGSLEILGYAVGAPDLPAAGVGAPQIRQRLWWVADAGPVITGADEIEPDARANGRRYVGRDSQAGGLGNAPEQGRDASGRPGQTISEQGPEQRLDGSSVSFWSDFDLIPCGDGKARRVEPGTFPLATGVQARVGKLRAYGNSIVPELAAVFMRCCS